MPELPDILLYIHALRARIIHRRIDAVRLVSPFVLRSVSPPISTVNGRRVIDLRRVGKRIAIEIEGDFFLVFHLMIAGRFRWLPFPFDQGNPAGAQEKPRAADEKRPRIPGKIGQLAIDFEHGSLIMTEAGTRKRASLHVVQGREALAAHDPRGLEVLETDFGAFDRALRGENHTLKRMLTDPHVFSGIGNAYSDEILHAARLSPFKMSQSLSEKESEKLFDTTRRVLRHWTERLQEEAGDDFPTNVTAFREGMAVHGRYGRPCPDCGSPVQRIVYAANEANYCATCQTAGRLLADRSLSRLLREDWPRSLEELEQRKQR